MPSNNSQYTEEMREQTAQYIIESGKSAIGVAEELGIDKNTVCSWVKEYRKLGCPYDNSCMESFFATLKKRAYTGNSMVQWKR